jgi:predicted lipid carrier protein YhbT
VTDKELVATKLQELIDRLAGADRNVQGRLADVVSSRVIQVDLPDLDVSFWTEVEGGRMDGLHEGPSPDVDIRLTAASDDLVAVIDGERSLFSSYIAGHVRIDASMSDLLALRKLL